VLRKKYIAFLNLDNEQRFVLVAEGVRGQWESYTFFQGQQERYIDGRSGGYSMGDKEQAAPGNCSVLHRDIGNPGPPRWINIHYSVLTELVKWR